MKNVCAKKHRVSRLTVLEASCCEGPSLLGHMWDMLLVVQAMDECVWASVAPILQLLGNTSQSALAEALDTMEQRQVGPKAHFQNPEPWNQAILVVILLHCWKWFVAQSW